MGTTRMRLFRESDFPADPIGVTVDAEPPNSFLATKGTVWLTAQFGIDNHKKIAYANLIRLLCTCHPRLATIPCGLRMRDQPKGVGFRNYFPIEDRCHSAGS